MIKFKKSLLSCFLTMTLFVSHSAYAISFSEILSTDTRNLNSIQYEKFMDEVNALGSVMMINIHTLSNDRVMPGGLTPEGGLDYIPDDEEAIDIYIGLIEEGTLPFGAVFLTNQLLFDL